jgi:hypothetical protein
VKVERWRFGASFAYDPLLLGDRQHHASQFFVGSLLGRSQLALLHFGQTRGLSAEWRGSHSWPHRHRQPKSITMPIFLAVFFMEASS